MILIDIMAVVFVFCLTILMLAGTGMMIALCIAELKHMGFEVPKLPKLPKFTKKEKK